MRFKIGDQIICVNKADLMEDHLDQVNNKILTVTEIYSTDKTEFLSFKKSISPGWYASRFKKIKDLSTLFKILYEIPT